MRLMGTRGAPHVQLRDRNEFLKRVVVAQDLPHFGGVRDEDSFQERLLSAGQCWTNWMRTSQLRFSERRPSRSRGHFHCLFFFSH